MSEPKELQTQALQLRAQWQRPGFMLDVDLQLPPRGVSVLYGPSGSGKTTCLRILAGLEPSAQARVSVGGELWQDSATRHFVPPHHRAVGYVFQEASLFEHLSVQDNLRYGWRRTPAALRRHHWAHGLDLLGIRPLLARRPADLSGGERQRVAIARALATSPRVLLMDEPLAALDTARKSHIVPWLEQLHERLDIPVVYVTHATEELARLADHLVLLDLGRATASGPAMELMTRLDLPLAHGDSAAAWLHARTLTSAETGLCRLGFDGGELWVPEARSTPLPTGSPIRVCIQSRDVSLSLQRAEHSSVLNILGATVEDLCDDGPGQVLVGLRVGATRERNGTRLLSRISAFSAQRLGVAPGLALFVQIKGVAVR